MTTSVDTSGSPANHFDLDRPVELHPLVYLSEGDEVTVGRPDTDSYGIVDPETAELIRRLEAGSSPRAVAAWYLTEYGDSVDLDDVLAALDELGFLRSAGEAPVVVGPVRWKRLGVAAFSPPAWIVYGILVAWAALVTVRRPDLIPSYRNMFFTDYYAIVSVVMFAAAVPQLLLHEGFHALAGRRLGLRSRLSVGRRLYFVVLETSMDGLVAVPRAKRYLPILAGMVADLVVVAALTIAADLSRAPGGAFSLGGRVCLAIALAVWLRIAWQFSFYLRTDLYVLISTAVGCVDLDTTSKRLLRNRANRLMGRHDRLIDESSWHPTDRRAARWYSWFIVLGYTVSLATLVFAAAPIVVHFVDGVVERFTGDRTSWQQILDSAVVIGFLVLQLVILGWLVFRDRRRQGPPLQHVVA